MEDDVFLRCIEANLLSDMTLQGIEAIAKVCTLIQLLVYLFLLKMSTYMYKKLHDIKWHV